MLGWFHALLPREERFFDLFARHSDAVEAGAKALREMLEGGEAIPRHYKQVMDREQDADNVTREVLIAVRRTFITPFDRGDIKDLITSMDNTIDQMQKTAKTIILFDQRAFTPQQREMADAIVTCAALVREAMPLLSAINSNAGRISEISEQLSQIEGRTDELHDVGLQELYRANRPSNSMEFFVGVEIYDHLEKVVDRFDDVGNEISGIVIENV
jgi:predicted phosphate transport protein (TIGR00153 family)